MAKMHPYLTFGTNCREAMEFYKACLGGELQMQTVGESPMAATMPTELHDHILHSELTKGNLTFMASDMVSSQGIIPGNTVTLCMVGETKGEIEDAFAKLSVGGNVAQPLKEEFFGTMGALTDKFGIQWMFQYGTGNQS